MNKCPETKCIELAQSIRLGEIYPNAISIVDAIEAAIISTEYDDATATNFTKLIKNIMFCQVRQDWLGVADYLEYDLPLLLSRSTTSNKL